MCGVGLPSQRLLGALPRERVLATWRCPLGSAYSLNGGSGPELLQMLGPGDSATPSTVPPPIDAGNESIGAGRIAQTRCSNHAWKAQRACCSGPTVKSQLMLDAFVSVDA